MPVEYVKAVERAQTWHLPDPVDPAPIERGIGVYFTALNWGGVSFAILEDRKFKTGPNGPLQLKPKFAPRPDWVTNADYDPKALDVPGAANCWASGRRSSSRQWGEDWTGAEFKAVLSQTIFSYATHISHGNRLLADLDSNGWPQSGRRRRRGSDAPLLRLSSSAAISIWAAWRNTASTTGAMPAWPSACRRS